MAVFLSTKSFPWTVQVIQLRDEIAELSISELTTVQYCQIVGGQVYSVLRIKHTFMEINFNYFTSDSSKCS